MSPCPFCGYRKPRVVNSYEGQWYVECGDCCAQGPLENTEAEARVSWETRPLDVGGRAP